MNTRITVYLLLFLLPACAQKQISYKQDIHPILESKCVECHTAPSGYGYRASGLQMNTYHSLMKGTIYGPVIISGDSRRSIINKLLEHRAGNLQNALHQTDADKISKKEIEAIKNWVDQGALNN